MLNDLYLYELRRNLHVRIYPADAVPCKTKSRFDTSRYAYESHILSTRLSPSGSSAV
jgi:hypothetical protein